MSGSGVRDLVGEPNERREYQLWKAWNPFYLGRDTARTDWTYAGEGRVVFARNRYSERLQVIEVVYGLDVDD